MRILFLLAFIISINSYSQNNLNKTLIGKWKLIAESGKNGSAQIFTNEIKNGETLIFESKSKLKNENGDQGTYNIDGNKLQINIDKKERFYLMFFDENNPNKIYLNPVTSKYEIICDEGCSFTYIKL